MKLSEYTFNLSLINDLLKEIKEEGIFANSLGGRVDATIHKEYAPDLTRQIPNGASDFIRLAVVRKVDRLALKLLRKADECGVDIIDDLIKALPKPYPIFAMDMQQPVEYFLEGELK